MKSVTKSFDTNAHIDSLRCEIKVDNDTPIAIITFTNISTKTITAVRFKARGYNSFGEDVKVNGETYFQL